MTSKQYKQYQRMQAQAQAQVQAALTEIGWHPEITTGLAPDWPSMADVYNVPVLPMRQNKYTFLREAFREVLTKRNTYR